MSNDTRIAVDIAKAVFEVAVSDRPGHVARRERLGRTTFGPTSAATRPIAPTPRASWKPAATTTSDRCP